VIPRDPDELNICAILGNSDLSKFAKYSESKSAIVNGQCGHTCVIENVISRNDGRRGM